VERLLLPGSTFSTIKFLSGVKKLFFAIGRRRSRDSSVGIATGYGLDDKGGGNSSPSRVKIFTSPYRPDRLWGPPNLL
jgi:hypothetical protein